MILQILKIVGALSTIATGLISVLRPLSVRGFTGLSPDGPRGVTEIRAVLGGLFVGLGLAPFILRQPAGYRALGIGYLVVAVVRLVSMGVDRSVQQSNIISLAFEVIFGIILVL
jgi:hypothetical protein